MNDWGSKCSSFVVLALLRNSLPWHERGTQPLEVVYIRINQRHRTILWLSSIDIQSSALRTLQTCWVGLILARAWKLRHDDFKWPLSRYKLRNDARRSKHGQNLSEVQLWQYIMLTSGYLVF